ncbi:MAG: substrate-binding domain-containing protein, partial [Deltaproteobacteria bacterium]|nr:substrate-binding domain-containing protein [Deltaproteobacteria bacterium]
KYTLISLTVSFALLPAAISAAALLTWATPWLHYIFNAVLPPLLLIAGAALLLARKTPLPPTLLRRWLPLCLPLLCTLLGSIPLFRLGGLADPIRNIILAMPAAMYLLYLLVFALACRRAPCARRRQGALFLGLLFTASLGAAGLNVLLLTRNTFFDHYENGKDVGHGVEVWQYMPFALHNKLVQPDAPPSLRLTGVHPRLDGAIAALPVYAAAAQALYTGVETNRSVDTPNDGREHIRDLVHCNNTREAFQRLLEGEADIFFGAAPSPEQMAELRKRGLTPLLTPLAREAFVFFVHRDNPLTGLSLEQIQAIYSKRITNWRQIDPALPHERILAFQRPEGSGSQSAMRALVMRDIPLAAPLREEYAGGMGELIQAVAEYRNYANSLGYSFRWYATEQYPSQDIRFLAVNGVLPTPENIRSGSYPLTGSLLALSCRPLSPAARALLNWLTGAEGQALIAKVGYVPLD